ncbi:hypothetical protein [Kibdelosporangium phytohabitans]|uniref:Uncharacterized protein n=1 Tax=Kibdelosporangium phytohabitans TaxID=860235 RepID=A0A0N9I1G0_9PSEU|nr:hypothetical protein [Kibdelosporangium phytohabitans]ALG12298.1 hypothetical protein AOZ06_40435 [Kibdelosporangium phytohabitans]MBE1463855.1 hypothetical protein [Kibdelosporangium phytohabitans]
MRLLVLYARSRGLLGAFALMLASAIGVRALDNPDDKILLLALAMGVAAVSAGLSSPDAQLDRTGSLPWPLWRGTHVVLGAAVVFGLITAAGSWDAGIILRDAAGLVGLTGLGAPFLGNQLAWTLPVVWVAVCVVAGPTDNDVLTWLVQSPESTGALLTAAALGLTGLAVYAIRGPRHT